MLIQTEISVKIYAKMKPLLPVQVIIVRTMTRRERKVSFYLFHVRVCWKKARACWIDYSMLVHDVWYILKPRDLMLATCYCNTNDQFLYFTRKKKFIFLYEESSVACKFEKNFSLNNHK